MDNMIKDLHGIIQIYNVIFIPLLISLIIIIFIALFCLFINNKDSFLDYWINIKHELIQMVAEFLLIFILAFFLFEIFNINIIKTFDFDLYGNIALSFWIAYHIKHLYDFKKYSAILKYIRKVKRHEYAKNPEVIFKEDIKHYNYLIEYTQEDLALYKSFSPIPLVVLVAGKIIDSVDMDKYITFFVYGIFLFFYKILNCRKRLLFLRRNRYEIEIALQEYLTEGIRQDSSDIGVINNNRVSVEEPNVSTRQEEVLIREPDGSIRNIKKSIIKNCKY